MKTLPFCSGMAVMSFLSDCMSEKSVLYCFKYWLAFLYDKQITEEWAAMCSQNGGDYGSIL